MRSTNPDELTSSRTRCRADPNFESAAQSNSGVDTTVATLVTGVPSPTFIDGITEAYAEDKALLRLMDHLVTPSRKSLKDLPAFYRSSADRYITRNE